MSNSKKGASGCLKFLALSAGLLGGACILYFIIVLPLNRQFNAEPSPTDLPESSPTNLPETYDQAVERILTKMSESMVTTILTFQSADFNIEQQSWRGAISNSTLDTKLAYTQLSNLQPPASNEQQHASLLEVLSSCNNSANWFDHAMQEYRQGNVEAYLASIEQAYIFWDVCEVELE